ncbi:MAG: hypothetical protein ABIQ18_46450 [Umezawaea sp.]
MRRREKTDNGSVPGCSLKTHQRGGTDSTGRCGSCAYLPPVVGVRERLGDFTSRLH